MNWETTWDKSTTEMDAKELEKEVWRLKGVIDKRDETINTLKNQLKNFVYLTVDIDDVSKEDYQALKRAYDLISYRYKALLSVRQLNTVNQDDIIGQIVKYYGLNLNDVMRKGRKAEIVKCRNACYFVLYQNGMSLSKIGNLFLKDHSSVIHGRDQFISKLQELPLLEQEFINGLIHNN